MASISVEVDIDLSDIFYQLDDKQVAAEMRRRKLAVPDSSLAIVRTAIAQIRRGDTLDAITTLEREFWPKWASVEDSESALRRAVGATSAEPANDNKEAALAASA